MRNRTSVLVGLAAVLVGLTITPVGAHFTNSISHVGNHVWQSTVRSKVYTRAQANARFYTRAAADARFQPTSQRFTQTADQTIPLDTEEVYFTGTINLGPNDHIVRLIAALDFQTVACSAGHPGNQVLAMTVAVDGTDLAQAQRSLNGADPDRLLLNAPNVVLLPTGQPRSLPVVVKVDNRCDVSGTPEVTNLDLWIFTAR